MLSVLSASPARRLIIGAVSLAVALAATVAGIQIAAADTGQPGSTDLAGLVLASRPQWNLARALKHDSCWPEEALDAAGNQKAPATRKLWPVPGQGGCVSAGSAFPTYYTAKQCSPTEVRVVYSLYFPKDGFAGSLGSLALGHDYDWEHVVVVWTQAADGSWHRDHLLLGRHGKEIFQAWSSAESWDATRTTAGLGLEYPRIFVGWAKHAMFNHQGGLTDLASQYTNEEFRNAAHPAWADWLIPVDDSGPLAQRFDAFDWGSASSTPSVMSRSLCSLVANG